MDLDQYQQFICPLDEDVLVLCLDPQKDTFTIPKESKWHFEMSMFDFSHAFAIWEDFPMPLILIDRRIFSEDWFTADHLFAILSHELGHIHLKTLDENAANQLALSILSIYGLEGAKNILLEKINSRSY